MVSPPSMKLPCFIVWPTVARPLPNRCPTVARLSPPPVPSKARTTCPLHLAHIMPCMPTVARHGLAWAASAGFGQPWVIGARLSPKSQIDNWLVGSYLATVVFYSFLPVFAVFFRIFGSFLAYFLGFFRPGPGFGRFRPKSGRFRRSAR